MALVIGGKHFGQYTYEHWFDHEYESEDKITVCEMMIEEINYISDMVTNIFDEFVGKDYSEEGNKTFKDYIHPQKILTRFIKKTSRFYVAKHLHKIIGVLEVKNTDHISLFFVDKEFQRKGIGKKLFERYLKVLKMDSSAVKTITVNSSIYAEKVYSKMGFIKTKERQDKDGIKFIPMEYKASL